MPARWSLCRLGADGWEKAPDLWFPKTLLGLLNKTNCIEILPLQSYLSTIPQFNQPDDLKVVTNPADNYDPEHTASRFSWSGECAWEFSHPVHH
jgi:hypothetical protein